MQPAAIWLFLACAWALCHFWLLPVAKERWKAQTLHGKLAQADYCAFENGIATHYRMRMTGGPDAQRAWADYFNAQRVQAIDWRAQVDPTLRGG